MGVLGKRYCFLGTRELFGGGFNDVRVRIFCMKCVRGIDGLEHISVVAFTLVCLFGLKLIVQPCLGALGWNQVGLEEDTRRLDCILFTTTYRGMIATQRRA